MNKRVILKVLTSMLLITMFALKSFAQKPQRLDLQKSASSVMEKSVVAQSQKRFVIYLKKGQKINISFIEDTRKGVIDFEKYSVEEGTENGLELVAPTSKDYTLILDNPNKKATSFRVFFSLTKK